MFLFVMWIAGSLSFAEGLSPAQKAELMLTHPYPQFVAGSQKAQKKLKPAWLQKSHQVQANSSYMDNRSSDPGDLHPDVRDILFKEKSVRPLRQEYQDMVRIYEIRKAHGLVDHNEEMMMLEKRSKFASKVGKTVVDDQIKDSMKEAEKNSSNVKTFRDTQRAAAQVISGKSEVAKVGKVTNEDGQEVEAFTFGTKTNLPNSEGGVWMKSFIVNAESKVVFADPWVFDPTSTSVAVPTGENPFTPRKGDKKVTAGVSRDLPWTLSSGLDYTKKFENYGSWNGDNSVDGNVTKQITPELKGVVSKGRDLNSNEWTEHVLKLVYEMSF